MSDYLRTLLGGLAHYSVKTETAVLCFNGPPGLAIAEAYYDWLGAREDSEPNRLEFLSQARKLGLAPVSAAVVDLTER